MTNHSQTLPVTISPAGESAVWVRFGESRSQLVDEGVNQRVLALAETLQLTPIPGLVEAVPGYASLVVYYDPLILSYTQASDMVRAAVDPIRVVTPTSERVIEIPVNYGGEEGPDLAFVAQHNHLSEEEVIDLHSRGVYRVMMMGFMPGFPYLGGMDPRIASPRLETPRSRVPAGSVGIAGLQTGVYPSESPGGWRIIGCTGLRLFDPHRDPPFLVSPGDRVRFTRMV